MKKLYLSAIVGILSISSTLAQNSVGIGTATPDVNAVLDLQSPNSNQGLLLPRLTTVERNAMVLGAAQDGLIVYDISDKSFWYWDGVGLIWQQLQSGVDNDWTGAGTGLMHTSYLTDNIGIGTTTPIDKLHVFGGYSRFEPNAGILGSNVSISTFNGGYAQMVAHDGSTSTIAIRSNGATFFNGGRVGIGTSTPVSLLNINDQGNTEAALHLQAGAATGNLVTDGLQLYVNSSSAGILNRENHSLHLGTDGTNDLTIASGGNVGIGTMTPSRKLHVVSGDIEIEDSYPWIYLNSSGANNCGLTFQHSGTNQSFLYYSGTGDYLYASASGNYTVIGSGGFGINTTSPVFPLDVNGNSRISGRLAAGGANPTNYSLDVLATSGAYGARIDYNQNVSATTYGLYSDVDNAAGGYTAAVFGTALADGGTNSTIGLRAYATGTSTGTKYGVYAQTGGSGTRYAGYFLGDVYCSGTYLPSDSSLKRNVSNFNTAIENLEALPIVEYEYTHEGDFAKMDLPTGRQIGIMALDIERVFPQLTKKNEFNLNDDPENPEKTNEENIFEFTSVNYTGLIPVVVKAIQEQQQQIELLQIEIIRLQSLVDKN